MANIFAKQKVQQLSRREQLTNKYMGARHNLLLVVIFTAVNIGLLVAQSNSYFLFSASIPYYLVDLGMYLCGKYPMEYYADLGAVEFFPNSFLAVMIVIAVVILALYLLAWILSKKPRVGWMIFALVIFALDTLFMLLIMGISADMILDVVFHGWVVISLISGISAYSKLKKLPEEAPEEQLLEEQLLEEKLQEEKLPVEEQLPKEFAEE